MTAWMTAMIGNYISVHRINLCLPPKAQEIQSFMLELTTSRSRVKPDFLMIVTWIRLIMSEQLLSI